MIEAWAECEACGDATALVDPAETPAVVLCLGCQHALALSSEEGQAVQLLVRWFCERYWPAPDGPYACEGELCEAWEGLFTRAFVTRVAELICESAQCNRWRMRPRGGVDAGGVDDAPF
jgi:hypothetical protein